MSRTTPFQLVTGRELDVLMVLWESKKPLVASEIALQKNDLSVNTVQAILRKLVNKNYIEVADIIFSGKVLSRCYRAVITAENFAMNQLMGNFKQFTDVSASHLICNLLKEEISLAELERLEEIIRVQKEKLAKQAKEKEKENEKENEK